MSRNESLDFCRLFQKHVSIMSNPPMPNSRVGCKQTDSPLSSKLALLVNSHEEVGQAVSLESQGSL